MRAICRSCAGYFRPDYQRDVEICRCCGREISKVEVALLPRWRWRLRCWFGI